MAGTQILTSLLFDIQTNTASLKKGLDEANSMFKGLGDGIGKIQGYIKSAFAVTAIVAAGKAVAEFALEVGESVAQVRDLTGTSGDQLNKLSSSILTTSKVFGTEFGQTLESVNATSKKLGISFNEASDIIRTSIALNDDHATELLSTFKQYSPTFKELGIEAQKIPGLLTMIYDGGTDAAGVLGSFEKANKNLREGGENVAKALAGIGLSSTQLQQQIESGAITEFEAIQKISTAMKGFSDNSFEVGKVLSDVFGKSSIAIGAEFYKSLGDAKLGMDDLLAAADPVEAANLRIAKAGDEISSVMVSLFGQTSTMWTELKATAVEYVAIGLKAIVNGVVGIANYFIDLYNNSLYFRAAIQSTILYFKELWQLVKLVGSNLINYFSTAGQIIKAVLTGNIKEIPAIIQNSLKESVEDFKTFGKESADNFSDAITGTLSKEKIQLIDLSVAEDDGEKAGEAYAKGFIRAQKEKIYANQDRLKKYENADPFAFFHKEPKAKKNQKPAPIKLPKIKIDIPDLSKSMPDLKKEYGPLFGLINGWKMLGYQMKQSMKDGSTATQAFSTTFTAMSNNAIDSIGDVVSATLNGIKQIVMARLQEAIAGVIASNAALGPFALVAIPAAVGAVMGLFNSLVHFENGGVSNGGLAMVGERGAELINLPRGAQVFNNRDTTRMLAGSGGALNIKVEGFVSGENIYLSQKEVTRRRGNSSF